MHEPTYRQAITHAWHLVWHHKGLWILGLLSVFLGQFGLSDFAARLAVAVGADYQPALFPWLSYFTGGAPLSPAETIALTWAMAILALVLFGALFISVSAQGSLIIATANWFKTQSSPNTAKIWNKGIKCFWPLLGMNILRKALLALVIMAAGYAGWGLLYYESAPAVLALLLIITLAVFFALMITCTITYASGFIALENKGFGNALKKGWFLFTDHLLVSLELSLILLVINVVLLAMVFMAFYLAFLPAMVIWILAGITGYSGLIIAGLIVGFILLVILVVVAAGIYNAFSISSWMYLFLKMKHEGIFSRLFQWAERLIR